MKKSLLSAVLTGSFITVANAQGSVTLYGVLDESLTYTNSEHSATGASSSLAMTNAAIATTVWGLKGEEDLGAGIRTIFQLESQFGLNNGANSYGTDEFGRQAWVGVSSTQWGAVTLGKQYSSIAEYLNPISAYGLFGGNMSAHPYDNDNVGGGYTVSNAIKYTSDDISGWRFGGMYAFSNSPGQFSANREYSVGASYINGPLHLGAAYLDASHPGDADNPNGAVGANMTSFNADNQRVWGAGASYAFGPATIGVLYSHSAFDALATADSFADINRANLHFDNYEINGRYFVTPSLSMGAAYTFSSATLTGTSDPSLRIHQLTLQTNYSLSKRTQVYLQGAYQHVSGGNGISLSRANIPDIGVVSGTNNQMQVAAGIRHSF